MARGVNFRYIETNGADTLTPQPTTLGIITVGVKGLAGNVLSLYNAQTADASKKICEIDTTSVDGPRDLGQIELNALHYVLSGGTAAKVTITWG